MVKSKLKNLTPLNTSTPAGKTVVDGPGAGLVGLDDMCGHIDKLKQVSATTKNLVHFLGDQLQALSATIPVLCGLDIVRHYLHRIISGFIERCYRRRNLGRF